MTIYQQPRTNKPGLSLYLPVAAFMDFQITHKDKDTKARTGKIKTDHGIIETRTRY